VTQPDRAGDRGTLSVPAVKARALAFGVQVLQPTRIDEAALREIAGLRPELLVWAAYGNRIPRSLLELVNGRAVNVHASLLPRWRGAAPVERAIMAGDTETGVTIHRTVKELDAGPIAAQRAFPIGEQDDAGSVYAKAAALAVELLDDVLPEPEFTPQDDEGATYAEKITAADRELDWSSPPEEQLDHIRALSPHIGARAELHGRPVTIWKARVAGRRLEPLEVQPDGKRRMTYDEFLRGLR
jgi:methionyl-tRNA formyltransferase